MTAYWLYAAVFGGGLLLGPLCESLLAKLTPLGKHIGRININNGLRRGNAWSLHEAEGRRYELQHLADEDDLPGALATSDDRIHEDVGLMGHIEAGSEHVPFGCTWEEHRLITSPLVATIGERYGQLGTDAPVVDQQVMTDGGTQIEGEREDHPFDDAKPVNWYRENALIARGIDQGHVVEVVNGAVDIPNAAIADIKETVRIVKHAGDPEQPKRAAENAENAERMRTGGKGAWEKIKPFAYIFMGFLLAWLGGELIGGGGGGGGGSVPGPDISGTLAWDWTPVFEVLASGVVG